MSRLIRRKLLMSRRSGAGQIACAQFYRPIPRRVNSDRLLVNSAAFSPDGKRVVTASYDNTARVWDLSGPQPVATVLEGHRSLVNSAAFSPDGKRVVTASYDNTAVVWPTPEFAELIHLAKDALTRCLTVAQRDTLGLPIARTLHEEREQVHLPPC